MPPKKKTARVVDPPVEQQPTYYYPPPRTELFLNLRSRSSITPGSMQGFASAQCQVVIGSKTQWYNVQQCDPPRQLEKEPYWSNSWWFLGPPRTSERNYSLYWSDVRYYSNSLPPGTDIIYERTGCTNPCYHIFVINFCPWEFSTSYCVPHDLRHKWSTNAYRCAIPAWPPAPVRGALPQQYQYQNQYASYASQGQYSVPVPQQGYPTPAPPQQWQQPAPATQGQQPAATQYWPQPASQAQWIPEPEPVYKEKPRTRKPKTAAIPIVEDRYHDYWSESSGAARDRRRARAKEERQRTRRHTPPQQRRHHHHHHHRRTREYYSESFPDYLRGYGNIVVGREHKPHVSHRRRPRHPEPRRHERSRHHHSSEQTSRRRRRHDYTYRR